MKKIQSLILALPLIVAAAFVSCTDDNDDMTEQQPEVKAVTFTATIPQTRVSYTANGDIKVQCDWEEKDNGQTVEFKEKVSENSYKTYKFTIGGINSDGAPTATLTYTGNCITTVLDDEGRVTSQTEIPESFPEPFAGTATYKVAEGKQEQEADNSTAHLGNGATIVAELTNARSGDAIAFTHPETAIFRVTFKAPVDLAAGAKLRINANGTDNLGEVTFNFPLSTTQADGYTAYVRCTTKTPINKATMTIDKIDQLTYVLVNPQNEGKNAWVCRKFYSVFTNAANENHPNGLIPGKYYYTDITEYTLTNTAIDPNTNEEKIWYEQETGVANAIGYAPLTVQYFPIPLNVDHQYTKSANNVAYYLYVGHDLLRKKSTTAKVQKHDDQLLYFYWGDVEGYTATTDNVDPEYIPDYYMYTNTSVDGFGYSNNVPNDIPFSIDSEPFNKFYCPSISGKEIPVGSDVEKTYFSFENISSDLRSFTLMPHVDAASCQWKGGWRMMDYYEALAFLKATKSEEGRMIDNTCYSYNGETLWGKEKWEYTYTSYSKDKNGNSVSITLPNTGVIGGNGNSYRLNFCTYDSNKKNIKFYSWLRHSTPEVEDDHQLLNGLYLCSDHDDTTFDGKHIVFVPGDNASFVVMATNVYDGMPVLPALVVNASTGEADF